MTRSKATKVARALLAWFPTRARDLPWRRRHDPYAVWVSEIMLQQTQVRTVIPYFERWIRQLPDVAALASAPLEKLLKLWEGLGYYTRVRNLQKAAQRIQEEHAGRFPHDFTAILALPGIGRYTAGAVASIAFAQPAPILDGNVIRVLTRLLALRENPREKATNAQLWHAAEALVQASASSPPLTVHDREVGPCSGLNQSLMELGALVCTPRQPQCQDCPLARMCEARKLGITEVLPALGARPLATARRFVACVLESDDHLLIRRRPSGVVNALLWEFPNVEVTLEAGTKEVLASLQQELGFGPPELVPLPAILHSITRYRIRLEAYRGRLSQKPPVGSWISQAEARKLPFTSAHKKLLQMALT